MSVHLIMVHYITLTVVFTKYASISSFSRINNLIELFFISQKLRFCYKKLANFSKNFGSVSAHFFTVSAETPKLAEMPISAETETETENSVVHY